MGVVDFVAASQTADAAREKARLITEALDTLGRAVDLDERDSLDPASWVAWYDATIPNVRDIKILVGAMEIELCRRRGEQIQAEGERRGGLPSKVTHRVTLPDASKKQRSRDRALTAQPERISAFVQQEAAAGRVPSVRGAVRAAKAKPSTKTERKRAQFTASQTRAQRHTGDVVASLDAVADGQRRTDAQLTATGLDVEVFLRRVRVIPWLAIDRTDAGTMFVIDDDLRDICDTRAPRPALGNQSIRTYL